MIKGEVEYKIDWNNFKSYLWLIPYWIIMMCGIIPIIIFVIIKEKVKMMWIK